MNRYLYNLEKEIFKTTFEPLMTARGKVLCSYEETRYFNSLVLVNSLLLLNEETTLPEKFKPIAGLHIGRKTKPLPKELKNILDNARKGVIYFSMGTVLKSQYVPMTLKLIEVFRKLKQTVIWNTEAKFPNLPSNVHTLKWAPQQSILSHPNCILFITHGGLFSLTEAVHFGVPIIGIPAFGDQITHVESAVRKGFAIHVDLSHSMSKDVYEAILTILSDPR
ncbi:unnamed protein product [Parnassius mnemosyne]|uniref:UDP-glucuronosyltransferase n=1 Tax=Parnassius mnemosyne TaxID=213953 RepID=A0AAV1LJ60_9NEOP